MSDDKTYDVICVGSATEDVFLQVADTRIFRMEDEDHEMAYLAFEYGAKVRVDGLLHETGGGATNTAVTFARMGLRTALVCQIGHDGPGERVLQAMAKEGIDTSGVVREHAYATAFSAILTGFTGDRTILVHRGAASHLMPDELNWDTIADSHWVYMNSLSGESAATFLEVADLCGKHDVKLAINPGKEQRALGLEGLRPVLQNTQVLFVNRAEAYEITGVAPDRGPEDERAMLQMLRAAGAETVVMTYGAAGSEAMDATGHYRIGSYPVEATSTVGAGDGFASACVVALHRGKSLPEALRIGAANAAGIVQTFGAKGGILTWEAAEAYVREHEIETR